VIRKTRLAALLATTFAFGLGSGSPALAKPEPAPPAAPAPLPAPKLVLAIAVDQFSADLFAQYREHYTGGFARLLKGAVYPSGFQSHAATETCPGHSTILTGVHPGRAGIVANNWFDLTLPRAEKRVYCSEDESDPASSSSKPVVSAHHLRVPTLGERIKAQWPGSRNVAVSAKDRAVMMMGGHRIDAAYWWLGDKFVTLKGREPVPVAVAENAAVGALLKKGAFAFTPPAFCAPHDRAMKAGEADIGTGRFALAAGQNDAFRVSPRIDAATADLAVALATDMKLGKGAAPDVLSVSFSATDYIGHAYGTQGMEMCIQMAQLDATIGSLFARLDKLGIDYVAVLTADHGGLDTPERLAQQSLPDATRVDVGLMSGKLSEALAVKLGLPAAGLVSSEGPFGDYYVSRALPEADRAKAITGLAALLASSNQVAAVFTHDELARTPLPAGSPQDWTLKERARASFDAERSGDVVSLLRRVVVPIPQGRPGYTATHGSPWDYDRRVPMLFWRKGMAGFEQPAPVETVDIAPTLAALIGLTVPEASFDGRCLDLDAGPGNTCPVQK
jgi:predicted AlkP superfamily pyrophosphatase or phosphodiesterase